MTKKLTTAQKIAKYEQEQVSLSRQIEQLNCDIGEAFVMGASTQDLEKQLTNCQRRHDRLKYAIQAAQRIKAEEDEKTKADTMKLRNEQLDTMCKEFLLNCERFTSGCQSVLSLFDDMQQQAETINKVSGLSPIRTATLRRTMVTELALALNVKAAELEDAANSIALNRNQSLLVKYHDLQVRSRVTEVA